MNELFAILIIFFISLIGSTIIVIFNLLPKQNIFSLLCYGYGLGIGLAGMQLFLYARFGITYSAPVFVAPWIIVAGFGIFKTSRYQLENLHIPKLRIVDWLFIIGTISLTLFVLFESLLRPVTAWDAFSSWLLKSKVFYLDKGITPGVFQYIESDYPLIIGLAGTFFYIIIGSINDRLVLILSSAFYIATGGIFFFWIKKQTTFRLALLFTFLLLSTQNLIRHGGRYEAGQADLALGYYVLAGTLLLLEYISSKNGRVLVLCAIFLGICSLIKNEGMFFAACAAGVGIVYVIKNRIYKHLLAFLFVVIPVIDWQVYKVFFDIPKLPQYITFTPHIERSWVIVKGFIYQMFNIQNWNLIWIGFAFSLAILVKGKKSYQVSILLFFILFQLFIYFGVFILTRVDPAEHIQNVFDRLLIHITPLVMLFIVLVSFGIMRASKRIKNFFT